MRTKDNPVQNVLPVEKTNIQERQVTVRVLTIGTRQVTQSLFHQLPSSPLIEDWTGELNGIIWGWVNLHDNCGFRPEEHFHAVWEKNGQLFKSKVVFPWAPLLNKSHKRWDWVGDNLNRYMELRQLLIDLDNIPNPEFSPVELKNTKECVKEELEELKTNWKQSFQAVKDAGQLFIAVSGVWK